MKVLGGKYSKNYNKEDLDMSCENLQMEHVKKLATLEIEIDGIKKQMNVLQDIRDSNVGFNLILQNSQRDNEKRDIARQKQSDLLGEQTVVLGKISDNLDTLNKHAEITNQKIEVMETKFDEKIEKLETKIVEVDVKSETRLKEDKKEDKEEKKERFNKHMAILTIVATFGGILVGAILGIFFK